MLEKTMKAVVVTAFGEVDIAEDVPVPVPGDYEALVKVHACGFCNGTDMGIIHGTIKKDYHGFPTVLGHEGAGEVIQVGKKVRYIQTGDRFIHPNLHADVGGGYTKAHGSMAQYALVSDTRAILEDGVPQTPECPFPRQHRFPKTMDFVDAGLLLSLAECHSAVINFEIGPGKDVLIYGAGPMGIALAKFCRLLGANRITQIDGNEKRLQMAIQIAGVDQIVNFTTQNVDEILKNCRYDVVIDAVGKTQIIYEASQRLKPGGRVGSLGVLKDNDQWVDTSKLQDHTMLHMLNYPYGEYAIMDQTIALIQEGKINPKDFITHVVPMEQIHTAMELVKNQEALKVVLLID